MSSSYVLLLSAVSAARQLQTLASSMPVFLILGKLSMSRHSTYFSGSLLACICMNRSVLQFLSLKQQFICPHTNCSTDWVFLTQPGGNSVAWVSAWGPELAFYCTPDLSNAFCRSLRVFLLICSSCMLYIGMSSCFKNSVSPPFYLLTFSRKIWRLLPVFVYIFVTLPLIHPEVTGMNFSSSSSITLNLISFFYSMMDSSGLLNLYWVMTYLVIEIHFRYKCYLKEEELLVSGFSIFWGDWRVLEGSSFFWILLRTDIGIALGFLSVQADSCLAGLLFYMCLGFQSSLIISAFRVRVCSFALQSMLFTLSAYPFLLSSIFSSSESELSGLRLKRRAFQLGVFEGGFFFDTGTLGRELELLELLTELPFGWTLGIELTFCGTVTLFILLLIFLGFSLSDSSLELEWLGTFLTATAYFLLLIF